MKGEEEEEKEQLPRMQAGEQSDTKRTVMVPYPPGNAKWKTVRWRQSQKGIENSICCLWVLRVETHGDEESTWRMGLGVQ